MAFQSSATLEATVGTPPTPPSLTGVSIGSYSYTQNTGTKLIPTARAFAGDALAYSLPGSPSGLAINASSGEVTISTTNTLSFTVVQVSAENAFGDAVTTDFNLTILAAASGNGGDPAVFETQDLVIGATISMDVAAAIAYAGGGTPTYALQTASLVTSDTKFPSGLNAPLGLSLNTSTGALAGTPCQLTPPMVVTVRCTDGLGFDQSAQATLGVTPKAGVPAPSKFIWTALPSAVEAAFGWDTETTVSTNLSALTTAILTARNDVGTVSAPKCHKITYTGGGTKAGAGGQVTADPGSLDDRTIVYVVGQDQFIKEWKTLNIRCVVENFTFYGGALPGRAIKPDCTGMALNCRIGGYWSPDSLSVMEEGASQATYNLGFAIWGCSWRGGENGPTIKTGRLLSVDCALSHLAIDGWRGYWGIGVQPFIYMYNVGNVMVRCQGWRTNAHGDIYQDGGGIEVMTENYENIWLLENTRYGTSGWRSQAENAPRIPNGGGVDDANMNVIHKLHQNVMAITGYDLLAGNRVKWDVDGFFGMPAPNVGSLGLGRSMNEPRPEISISNYFTTGNTASAVQTNCPNVPGSDVFHEDRTNVTSSGNMFICDLPQAGFHPQSWRDYISTVWQPVEGWAAEGLTDPANYGGIFNWGAVPAWQNIAISNLTGLSVNANGFNGSVTLPGSFTGGLLFVSVTLSSSTPRWPQLRCGTNLDGTAGFTQAKPIQHPNGPRDGAYYGAIRTTGVGTNNVSFLTDNRFQTGVTYYAHVGYEHTDGSLSNIISSGPLSY